MQHKSLFDEALNDERSQRKDLNQKSCSVALHIDEKKNVSHCDWHNCLNISKFHLTNQVNQLITNVSNLLGEHTLLYYLKSVVYGIPL